MCFENCFRNKNHNFLLIIKSILIKDMKYNFLGTTGVLVSQLCFGTMTLLMLKK
jgi:hypothetical protein